MSDSYTKLFSSITESTVWGEPYPTRIVWVAMLAMADKHGIVYGSIPGLARRANVTLAEAETALCSFRSPDPYSRTQADDGRRIEDVDGGWRLVNHGKYAAVRNAEERAEYKREWDRKNRSKSSESDKSDTIRQLPTEPTGATPLALTPALEDQKLSAKKDSKSKAKTLIAWIADLDGDAILAADPIFDWAGKVGIPRDWIVLAWWSFEGRYTGDGQGHAKKYTDWRATFRNAVKDDWLKLWYVGKDGYVLTTAGQQAQREMAA